MATDVVGISVVKDEADIIESTIRHMQGQVDRLLIADNGSTDGTREILNELGVMVIRDPDPAHYQSRKMTALAMQSGAEWVVPFDADERWYGRDGTLRRTLTRLDPAILIAEATLFDHVATPSGLDWRKPLPTPMRKVACRVRRGMRITEGNHGAAFPDLRRPPAALDAIVVHHFPYRSAEHMIAKTRKGAAALAATDLPEEIGKHWRDHGRLTDEQLREAFHEHYFSADPEADGLIFDPAP